MRHLIDIVSNKSPLLRESVQILDEGAKDRYAQMFQSFGDASRHEAMKGAIEQDIENNLNWALKTLRREDRIVWYLRLYRINLLQTLLRTGKVEDDKKQKMEKALDKWIRETAQKANSSVGEVTRDATEIKSQTRKLEHIASMFPTIQKMETYQWGAQSMSQLLNDMEDLEEEWKAERDADERSLDPTEDDYDDSEKLIDFGDGFAWWSLGVNYCRQEGNAMGHCGNTASYTGDDVVLSLRRRVNGRDVPFLTFILDERTGLLGEMKGRANEKPAPRYHRYIVALLRHPKVEGIKGGGYAPENNFSLSDLPQDVQDQLMEEKPQLANVSDFYRREGMSDRVFRMLKKALLDHDIPTHDFEVSGDDMIVGKFTVDDIVYDEDHLCAAVALYNEGVDDVEASMKRDDIIEVLDRLPVRDLSALARRLGYGKAAERLEAGEYEGRMNAFLTALAEQVHGTAEGKRIIQQTFERMVGDNVNFTQAQIENAIRAIITYGFVAGSHAGYIEFGPDLMSDYHKVKVRIRDLIDMTEELNADDPYGDQHYYIKDHGWIYPKSYIGDWSENIKNEDFHKVLPTLEKMVEDRNFDTDMDNIDEFVAVFSDVINEQPVARDEGAQNLFNSAEISRLVKLAGVVK